MSYQYIDLAYLETISSGDKDLRQTLLQMVKSELETVIPVMTENLQAKNWESLHEIVHKLKSTLAFVGNPDLTNANQQILSHLEEKNYDVDFSSWFSSFQQLSNPILSEIEKELDTPHSI